MRSQEDASTSWLHGPKILVWVIGVFRTHPKMQVYSRCLLDCQLILLPQGEPHWWGTPGTTTLSLSGILVSYAASNSMLEIWLHNLHMKFTMEFILKQCFRIFPAFFMEMFPQKALAQGPLSLLFPKNYLLSTTAGNWILFNLAGAQKSGRGN